MIKAGEADMGWDIGIDGIFVSNHAGNVNDAAVTAWDILPAIADVTAEGPGIICIS